ncbi:MAG TPA: YfhO family protein [Terriglobia bacterium]|nr:YfhO family protein [Terriglobia bacterium]
MPEPVLFQENSFPAAEPHHFPAQPEKRLIGRADAGPLAALAVILVLIFWRVLFTGQLFFYRDVFSYTYPRSLFIHAMFRSGQLPYWNPYFSFGEPAIGNPNYLFFYPSTLLIALLPTGLAYSLHYVLSFAWAALGAYLLARRWDQSRPAAFFAAAIFAFSGPVLSLGNLYNQAAATAWIPWALLATDHAVRRRSRRAWILLAAVFALQFLGAEPLTLCATFTLAVAYALFETLRTPEGKTIHSVSRLVVVFAAVGLIMLALSAVQLLPSLDVLHRARRGSSGLPYGEVVYWSLHPLSLVELVLPGFFGNAFDPSPLWTYVLAGRNQPYYVSVFVGFVPLLLAWIGWSEGHDRRRVFAGVGGVLLLLLACGRYTPLFAEAYLLLPPLALVRFPAKLLVPAVFMIAILAGWGVDAIRRPGCGPWRRRTVVPMLMLGSGVALIWVSSVVIPGWIERGGAAILRNTNHLFAPSAADDPLPAYLQSAAVYLRSMVALEFPGLIGFFFGGALWLWALASGRRWSRRGLPVVVALGVVQIVWANYTDNPTVPPSFYAYQPPVTAQPPDPSGPYRFAYIQREQSIQMPQPLLNFDSIPEARSLSPAAQLAFHDRLLLDRGAMLTGIEMAENLDMEGSLPPAYYEFWIHETREEPDQARADCLLGRANVKYIVRQLPRSSATARETTAIFNGSPDPSALYEDLCFVPRAYALRNAQESEGGADTLSRLSDPKFDIRTTVILEERPGPAAARRGTPAPVAGDSASGATDSAGTVRITSRTPNAVNVQAEMREAGYVVLLDRWDPGWRATVDGRAVMVLIANHMFRAVQVSSGVHQIEFTYHPRGLVLGASISAATLIGLLILWRLCGRTRRAGTRSMSDFA